MSDRPQKITFAQMRDMGVRGLLIYCADYRCSHSIAISGDAWPDDVRLSDIEDRFVCRACGKRGALTRTIRIADEHYSVLGLCNLLLKPETFTLKRGVLIWSVP
jgi:hypothetical protein